MLRTRQIFDQELQGLLDEIMVMGSMVEDAVMDAVDALKSRDLEASQALITADRVINICERTLFVDTGELAEIKASDDETQE